MNVVRLHVRGIYDYKKNKNKQSVVGRKYLGGI